jgi:hypothetical protein
MPELQSLLLVLLIIYGTECLVWTPLGAVAFAAFRGARFRILHPSVLAGNQRGGLVVAQPLPPLGFLFMARPFPLSVSPDGIFSFTAASIHRDRRPVQSALYVGFQDLKEVRAEGRKVFANGKLLLKAASTIEATRIVTVIKGLANLPAGKRPPAIREFIAKTFDTAAIETRLKRFRAHGQLLRRLGNVLLAFLFLIAPAVIWRFGFRASGWPLLGALFLQTIPMAFLFRRAHKEMFPTGADERFVPFMLMLLAPASAIRAHDFLARHVLSEFHPLAVAKVLCPPNVFKTFARHAIADLRYPMHPIAVNEVPQATAAEQWFRTTTLNAAEDLVRASSVTSDELTMKPSSPEPQTQSYCPRCGMQFVTPEAACGDCGGRLSIPLEVAT